MELSKAIEIAKLKKQKFDPVEYYNVTDQTKYGYEYGEVYDEETKQSYKTNKYLYFQFYDKNEPVNYFVKMASQVDDEKVTDKLMLKENLSMILKSNIEKINIKPVVDQKLYEQALKANSKEVIQQEEYIGSIQIKKYFERFVDLLLHLKENNVKICYYKDHNYENFGDGKYEDVDYENAISKFQQIKEKI